MVLKFFISSRIRGLKKERKVAYKVIKEHRFDPNRCEDWGASASHTEETCRRQVRASDVVVFILGRQCSQMVAKEYSEAKECRKPCLVFVKQVQDRDPPLTHLISRMKKHAVYKDYSTSRDLEDFLNVSISDLVERRFRSEKEKAIIQRARAQCGLLNDKILKTRKKTEAQVFKTFDLKGLKLKLVQEKRNIERILEESS